MIIKKSERSKKGGPACTVYEYKGVEKLSLAFAEVRGRFPDKDWGKNTACTEAYYVVAGKGKVNIEGKETEIIEGDVVIFKPGEKYFVEGNLDLVIPSTPAWSVDQYEFVEE